MQLLWRLKKIKLIMTGNNDNKCKISIINLKALILLLNLDNELNYEMNSRFE